MIWWKRLAKWAAEQAVKWGAGKVSEQIKPKRRPRRSAAR